MPWPLKILIKIVLSYLPWFYPFLKRLGWSQLGQMDTASYARRIFEIHVRRAFPQGLPSALHLLELGPGDSLAAALLGASQNAKEIFMIDAGSFANRDVNLYQEMAQIWQRENLVVPNLINCKTVGDVLRTCHGTYLTDGLASLQKIDSESIDFSWSHSVLEHIRKHEFLATFQELKRITKPGGLSSHIVDLQDHLDHSLNNLRFSDSLWEAEWFARGAFYTNRIRAGQMMGMMQEAGFTIIAQERGFWSKLPIARHKLHADYRDLPDQELLTRTFSVILRA